MGWSTWVKADIDFNRRTYNSLWEVEDDIKDATTDIENAKKKVVAWAFGRPQDFYEKDSEGNEVGADSLIVGINELFEILEESIIDKYKLELLKENFDEREGDFVDNPKKKSLKEELRDEEDGGLPAE